jgi:Kef-type K+ transport system membrane component KefB
MLAAPALARLASAAADPGGLFSGSQDTRPDGSVTVTIDTRSFLVVVLVSALASLLAVLIKPRLALPVVVLELLLGIVVGPDVLGLVDPDDFITFFANLGLGMLFFFAGYEIDFARIRGAPVKLAALGWLLSLALAYSLGGLLALAGVVVSLVFTGSALVTTAMGTLIPIMGDAGVLRTRFGAFALAAGAVGEFGPIMLVTLLLSTTRPLSTSVILILFVLLAVATALIGVRWVHRGWGAVERTLEASGQLAVRIWVLVTFALVALAASLGLDLLLGGFAAGIATRVALGEREVAWFESKLTAVGYGFFIPFFFIVSGVKFDLVALGQLSALAKLPLFVVLFLVVRGVPALVLYRSVLARRERIALALLSATELPLVVAITTIALEDGHMRSSTAAALVGAAIISTACFPLLALRLREGSGYRPGGWWGRLGSRSRSEPKAGASASKSAEKTGPSAA